MVPLECPLIGEPNDGKEPTWKVDSMKQSLQVEETESQTEIVFSWEMIAMASGVVNKQAQNT